MKHPVKLLCLVSVFLTTDAEAVVWSDPSIDPPTEQAGVMKHVGRLHYTRFEVFGGSCIWIGGKWVLTARHGVSSWTATSLKVDFPEHGKQRYPIQAIHLPPDKNVDLAVLELKESLSFDQAPTLDRRQLLSESKICFGGYGCYGPTGKIEGMNRFHWGTNRFDSADAKIARFSLGPPTSTELREAIPAIFDSGSPVFLIEGKQKLLTGVVIRVSHSGNPGLGDRAVITCLAGQAEWLKKVTANLRWHQSPTATQP